MVRFQSFIQRAIVKVPKYEFWSIRRYRIQFMNVVCNVFNCPGSISMWMTVHKHEKKLGEFPGKVERAEWDWQQLNVGRAKCFANKDCVAPLFVDKNTPPPCSFLISTLSLSRRIGAPKPSTVNSWLCTWSSSQVSIKASETGVWYKYCPIWWDVWLLFNSGECMVISLSEHSFLDLKSMVEENWTAGQEHKGRTCPL